MGCFKREQLQPPDNPFLCRSQDPTRYAVGCCESPDFCNRDIVLNLKDLDEKDGKKEFKYLLKNAIVIIYKKKLNILKNK
jgi:hypothetical protein